jgi:hypothetical protein
VVAVRKELVTGMITLLLNVVTISCSRSILSLGYTDATIINQKESDLVMIIIIINNEGSIKIKWSGCKVDDIFSPLLLAHFTYALVDILIKPYLCRNECIHENNYSCTNRHKCHRIFRTFLKFCNVSHFLEHSNTLNGL